MLCFCLIGQAAEGADINAATPSLTDVQSAVNSASTGDRVLVPSGTATWSGALSVKKNIQVIGNGTNNTIITCSGDALSMGTTARGVGRVSGFRFLGGSGGDGISVTMSATNYIRVDHCDFRGFQHGFYVYGIGLIDHCTFTNCTFLGFVQGPSPNGAATRAEQDLARALFYPVNLATTNALFLEDCTITWASFNNSANYVIQTFQAASYVVRSCTINMNATDSFQQFWDYHGNQGSLTDQNTARGSIVCGIYNNVLNHTGTSSSIQWCYFRAGSGLVFSNRLTGTISGADNTIQEEDADGSKGYTGPPYYDIITNVWIWNNTYPGGTFTGSTLNAQTEAVRGTAVFFSNSPPATIVTLAYPHPLITAQDGGDTTPPTVSGATINSAGTAVTVSLSEPVSIGAGGSGGLALTMSGGPVTLTYSSGSGTAALVFTTSRIIGIGETVTSGLNYTQPGNGIEDASGNDLASFTGTSLINNSSQDITAPTLLSAIVASTGNSVTFGFSESVTFGSGGVGSGTWALTMSGGVVNFTYVSGSGSASLVYSTDRQILASETKSSGLNYTQPNGGNGIEDLSGNDLANLTGANVLNSSAAVPLVAPVAQLNKIKFSNTKFQ